MLIASDKRFRHDALFLGMALVVFILILGIYLEQRGDLSDQRTAEIHALADARSTLDREKQLRVLLSAASFSSDASTVEGQVMHLLNDWEQQAGVSNASFQRSNAQEEHGLTYLTMEISASGSIESVGGLLYRVETSPIPLRVESVTLRPVGDSSDELMIALNISTPCRGKSPNRARSQAMASLNTGSNGG